MARPRWPEDGRPGRLRRLGKGRDRQDDESAGATAEDLERALGVLAACGLDPIDFLERRTWDQVAVVVGAAARERAWWVDAVVAPVLSGLAGVDYKPSEVEGGGRSQRPQGRQGNRSGMKVEKVGKRHQRVTHTVNMADVSGRGELESAMAVWGIPVHHNKRTG